MQPQSQLNVDPGSNITFSVKAEKSSSYRWFHNASNISSENPHYQGITNSILTILNVSNSEVGSYHCLVGNVDMVTIPSDRAQLTLCK